MPDVKIPEDPILAIDPGGATGVVTIVNGKVDKSWTLNHDEVLTSLELGVWSHYKIWVVESFVLYPWKSTELAFDSLLPARIIGSIELAAKIWKVELVFQSAVNAKKFSTDDKLKHFGWTGLKSNHEKDAARHAMLYLLQKGSTK